MAPKEKGKKKEKPADTADMPPCEAIKPNKPRTYASVVTLSNNFTAKVKDEVDETKKLEFLKEGIVEAVKSFISITFERADVNDLISNHSDFKHLQHFDPAAIFNADVNALHTTKVLSMISNLQETVVKLVEKPSKAPALPQPLINKLEKVKYEYIIATT